MVKKETLTAWNQHKREMEHQPGPDIFDNTIGGFDDHDLESLDFYVKHEGLNILVGEGDYVDFADNYDC